MREEKRVERLEALKEEIAWLLCALDNLGLEGGWDGVEDIMSNPDFTPGSEGIENWRTQAGKYRKKARRVFEFVLSAPNCATVLLGAHQEKVKAHLEAGNLHSAEDAAAISAKLFLEKEAARATESLLSIDQRFHP